MSTIYSLLDDAAQQVPDKPLFMFPGTRWNDCDVLTYGDLSTRATAAANVLRDVAAPGDRAVLLFPTGPAFWEAFFGCLASGVIAVPLPVPSFSHGVRQLEALCQDCRPTVLVSEESTADLVRRRLNPDSVLARLPVIHPVSWRNELRTTRFDEGLPSATAFLQYSSGSTAQPKGIQISHENVLANLANIRDRMGMRTGEDACVTWLPHHHDMGLIGTGLSTLFTRITAWCIRPEEFVLRPASWLQLISDYRASICGGPDFAYRLCTEKIRDEDLAKWDLSAWRVAFVGAERVRATTLRRFAEKFAPAGFCSKSFFPCYGLGEATLMVTGGPVGHKPDVLSISLSSLKQNRIEAPSSAADEVQLVSNGCRVSECDVAVWNQETGALCDEGGVGEIVIAGPSVTSGYFGRPEFNESLFVQVRVGDVDGTFLRTGDLGFLRDGRLFVTGRVKEMMVIRGKKFAPEDVEHAVEEASSALQAGAVAAFSVEDDQDESLVVVAELQRSEVAKADFGDIVGAVRRGISERFGIAPSEVLIIRPAGLPRTSSGKPRRLALRDNYRTDDISAILHRWSSVMRPGPKSQSNSS